MRDQAEELRKKLNQYKQTPKAKTIAVMSGKGGVGKSNVSLNFALALQKQHKKILLFDMDIGMANLDILMGRSSEHTILDFFNNKTELKEVISKGPEGLEYVSGGSGLSSIFRLSDSQFSRFINELSPILYQYDYIIFDMGAGVTDDSLKFLLAAEEHFVIATPEPTSLMDAYAAMKYICLSAEHTQFLVAVNRSHNLKNAQAAYERLSAAARHFLKIQPVLLGCLPEDEKVSKAVMQQVPVLQAYPNSGFGREILNIAGRYTERFNDNEGKKAAGQAHPFISKLRELFLKGRVAE
ncbi:P-loop NTPase [Bacillus lacus]|uniref:P-loop NTPase n=1 Tax=Metabacillus lacus TaxID=1983721 RepID=A0A7X2LY77_9BACI|nr:MinD/ParA family protein [Metabacillus lacus]MRX70612.1 P-loop NTPase [Metabacillus lacus]